MSRTRFLLLSAVSVVLVAALVGGATFALFSAQSVNSPSEFTAGTLSISNQDKTPWSDQVSNMAPGDVYEKTITVTNTGSIQLEFAGTVAKSGALFAGSTPAVVDLLNSFGVLDPGAAKDVTVRITLPLNADNAYQTAKGDFTITFYAFQKKNVTDAAGTWVQTNTNAYNPARNAWYDGYALYDGVNLVQLTSDTLVGIYEIRPDGTSNYLEVTSGPDYKYWMNQAKPSGLYTYVAVTKNGIRYTAPLNHTQTLH